MKEMSYFVTFVPIKSDVRIYFHSIFTYLTSGTNFVNFLPMVYHVMEGFNIVHNIQPR